MDISKQCCTLEQAKKLKELGVKQESYFWWVKRSPKSGIHSKHEVFIDPRPNMKYKDSYSAFTVAELGEMVSMHGYDEHSYATISDEMGGEKGFTIWDVLNDGVLFATLFPTEAEARAYLLIHLLESKTITATEVNERK